MLDRSHANLSNKMLVANTRKFLFWQASPKVLLKHSSLVSNTLSQQAWTTYLKWASRRRVSTSSLLVQDHFGQGKCTLVYTMQCITRYVRDFCYVCQQLQAKSWFIFSIRICWHLLFPKQALLNGQNLFLCYEIGLHCQTSDWSFSFIANSALWLIKLHNFAFHDLT